MSSDEESDKLTDLEAFQSTILTMSERRNELMQVSAWEDNDNDVDEERDAREPDAKAILCAAEQGELEEIQNLLSKNSALIDATDGDGYTPLHRASYSNNVEIVKYLLGCGAKIDALTVDGWQPLHSACCWNNVECAAVLLANGADVNARSKGDQTPLHLAAATSHNSPLLQLLLLHPDTNPHLVNSSGDSAKQIASRSGKYYPIFEVIEDCLNVI